MVPDNFHHADKVDVRGDLFQVSDSPAITEMNLTSSEIRQTSTVFADDPFRAVQTLPGVSAEGNNEFFAEFSVMGAPFADVAVYIDDVVVLNPFHVAEGNASGEGARIARVEPQRLSQRRGLGNAGRIRDSIGTDDRGIQTSGAEKIHQRCIDVWEWAGLCAARVAPAHRERAGRRWWAVRI